MSAIIGPFPSTLVNGTVEDANQVQTLLNWIQSQVNTNATGGVGTSARNLIYNGAMQLAQRTGQGISVNVPGGTKTYTLDRWQVSAGVGSSVDVVQLTTTGLLQFQNAIRVQRTSGNTATTVIALAQSMETTDSYPLQGQVVNVSFMGRAGANYSPTGNALTVTLYTGTGFDENVLTGYTGSVTAIAQTFNITNNWLPYSMSGTLVSNLTEYGIILTMNPTGTAGTNDYVDLTAIQVELGPSASTFDVRPYSETLARCQRYYQKSFNPVTPPEYQQFPGMYNFQLAYAGGGNPIVSIFGPPVTMRLVSVGTIYNPYVSNNNQIYNVTAATSFTACDVFTNGTNIVLQGTTPSGSSQGDLCAAHWTIDAEL